MLPVKKVKPYTLISKEIGLSPALDRIFPEQLSLKDAKTVDVVVIGETANPEKKQIITTFRDKKNKIIERVQEYEGYEKPEVHKLYSKLPSYGSDLKGKLIQTFENLDITGKFKVWKKVATEKQYVDKRNSDEISKVTIAKVTTDERFLNPTKKEHHSLTEYYVPKANGGKRISPRYIEFDTEKTQFGVPEITSISSSPDVIIPQKDKYLAMRIYDAEDVRIPITKTALKENGLENLRIPVEESHTMSETTTGSFNDNKGIIYFNAKTRRKPENIDTAYHESHHAYQYAVLGVTGKLDTSYCKKCSREYKGDISPQLEAKANRYLDGHHSYTSAKKNYDEYRKNILEEEAWRRGEEGVDNYIYEGMELSEQFSGIPEYEL